MNPFQDFYDAAAKFKVWILRQQIDQLRADQNEMMKRFKEKDSSVVEELSFSDAIAQNHRHVDQHSVAVDRNIRQTMVAHGLSYEDAYRRVNPKF
jgi:hypothetical protein